MNNEDPSIQNFINMNLRTLTHNLNNVSENISEYIKDSRVLGDFGDNELINIRTLLYNDILYLNNEINKIGNLLESIARGNIIKKALRLNRKAILVFKKIEKELIRRGLLVH
jgi:hypothetical protein